MHGAPSSLAANGCNFQLSLIGTKEEDEDHKLWQLPSQQV